MPKHMNDVPGPPPGADAEDARPDVGPERNRISRRKAIPIIGLAMVAAASCDLNELVEVNPNEEADRIRKSLAAAQQHRGGIQRYALHDLADNVGVRVEPAGTKSQPDLVNVTVFEVDPVTRLIIRDGVEPRVLEFHSGVSNATLSQVESEYVLFYYLETH